MKQKFYPKEYLSSKSTVLSLYAQKGLSKTLEACVCSGIPLIAALSFISESEPSEEVLAELEDLCKFYDVEVACE